MMGTTINIADDHTNDFEESELEVVNHKTKYQFVLIFMCLNGMTLIRTAINIQVCLR